MTKLSIMRLSLAALAFAALAPAQETKETPKASSASKPGCCVQQVYQVKHANVRDLYQLLFTRAGQDQTPYLGFNESLKAISIYGTQSEVRSIMANLAALDVPVPGGGVLSGNAEITFWLVAASAYIGDTPVTPILPDLMPALKAVAGSFGYKYFSLMDSAVSLTKAGSAFNLRGNATPPTPKLASKMVANYSIGCMSVGIESGGGTPTVNLERFTFSIQVPYCTDADCTKTERTAIEIAGSFKLREGQRVVIGKSKLDGTTKDLILIVSAKVVD
jgi:hypothetical protein